MLYLLSVLFIILIQLIYTNGTDIPFYYKEIMYDWNYTTNHNIKFNRRLEWISLVSNKGKVINIIKEQERATLIQTDLFSQQQSINIHEYLNTTILVFITIAVIYIIYTSINAMMYKHEKQKIVNLIRRITFIIAIIIYTYNTELLTSILYKTHFTYTDNIYVTNEKETTAIWMITILVGLLIYYFNGVKQLDKRRISRFSIYVIIVIFNIISENTLVGVEYLYFFVYVEILLLASCITINLKNR